MSSTEPRPAQASGAGGSLALYAATIFTSAGLLFLIQPMFARLVLPLLGGSPSVWNTALVFYQAALLAGYAYAHVLTTRLTPRRAVPIHLVLLAVPLVLLPIAVPAGWVPPASSNPVSSLLLLLLMSVGLPFFAVSTTSPILQKWFSGGDHRVARDPYFLYAASNAGSMLALLAYPFVVEPRLTLAQQGRLWQYGYGLFFLLMLGCSVLAWRQPPPVVVADESTDVEAIGWRRRVRWVLSAMAPSSLMIGVTTYMSNEIAAIPLMWIVPLAIYLLSFILVFAARPPIPHLWVVRALPIFLIPLAVALTVRAVQPMSLLIPLHLLVLFLASMACHGEIARDRPSPRHLTSFYLSMSLGGVLGGAFNALLAPAIFRGVTEYPLMLVAAYALLPAASLAGAKARIETWQSRTFDLLVPAAVFLITLGLIVLLQSNGFKSGPAALAIMFGPTALLCFSASRRPMRFALAIGAVLACGSVYHADDEGETWFTERSFFGVHRVSLDSTGEFIQLMHGNTLHGAEARKHTGRPEALTYYYRTGPAGQTFELFGKGWRRIGVVGLGVGSLAAYVQSGQRWSYYEIDPVVEQIARNHFGFLGYYRDKIQVTLGDARLSLKTADNAGFDVLVLDAYSSDAIPVHLLTREAMQLYLSKLKPHGLLMFHISNRHLMLEPVLAELMRDSALQGRVRMDLPKNPAEARHWNKVGKQESQWAVLARRQSDLGPLLRDPRWTALHAQPGSRVWTDDYSSILPAIQWR